MKNILVLPGGGAKGYLQLSVLVQLESLIKKPIHEYFDLIVGSSVGGINAAVLASGKLTAEKYREQFIPICEKTFSKNYFLRPPIVRPIYSRSKIVDFSKTLFNDAKMNSLKTKVMITSVSELDERTHFFKSWEPKDGNELLRDVLPRTFAAPYYFGHAVDEKNRQVWMDGGVGINNDPTDFAYIEAERQGWNEFRIIVIGTGFTNEPAKSFHEAKDSSQLTQLLTYISPLTGGLARAQFDKQQQHRYEQLSENNPNFKYDYVNVELPKELDVMDCNKLEEYDFYIELMKFKLNKLDF